MTKIQLYSLGTPNGQKVSIALEEMKIPYEAHRIDILKGDQHKESFKKINPNSKIPAIVDPDGPGGKPLSIMESGAILLYLAGKSGSFLSADPREYSETLQWLFFQVGGVGPMFGQFGHFYKYAPEKIPYAIERYQKEVRRILGVLDQHLKGKKFLVGDEYSIADMATSPWVSCLDEFYKAKDFLGLEDFPEVMDWVKRINLRPLTARGRKVLE